ncbi:tetratricopeptide repeat protein [Clostridium sp. AL.422]|uniref:tetratricopeptide repeat protein n=1 Tax=Clostridium TaxID=1485 RepID=UPI00293DF568|nr:MULTISPECIES: tetratricopeptide repeat protein [unclassified Clostridium]MDV4150017.1 tetratricopeptide repeat protein [Clostridium sp. AL.422]
MKKFIKLELIFIIIILTTSLLSCVDTTKKVTVSNNTEDEILVEENISKELIHNGNILLLDKKYNEAMANYNKAIELDKSNKDLYIEIKDIYLDANRYDDAYFIAKTAISNNVDTENMKKIAKDISDKLEIIKINDKVDQDLEYYFPQTVNALINGKDISLSIKWDYPEADTSTPGTFEYYGYNEEYGRKVQVTLTVTEAVYDKQIGSITDIYTVDGKTFIDVDLVEFYLGGEIALKEALKDNVDLPVNDDGIQYIPNGYYIRNNYSKLTTYEVSNNCNFQLLHHDFVEALGLNPDYPGNSAINIIASFDNFRNFIDLRGNMDVSDLNMNTDKPITNRGTLCWIELKNNVAYSIYRQYTP